MAVALVTDSASALTPGVCRALGIGLVDLRVLIDGRDRADSDVRLPELEPHLKPGGRVSTSQPSPAAFAAAYARAAEEGADLVWSVHPGAAYSGTGNAARLAARGSPIEVRVIDSGTISMAQGLCVLRALAALRDDPSADVEEACRVEMATQESLFVSLSPTLLARSGRVGGLDFTDPLPVLSMREGRGMTLVGRATSMDHAVDLMAGQVARSQPRLTLAVGDGGAPAWGERLAKALDSAAVGDGAWLFRYQVPASVTAQAGPTVGVVMSGAALPPTLMTAMSSAFWRSSIPLRRA